MEMMQNMAEQRLATLGMDDMPIVAHTPTAPHISGDWYARYRDLRRTFMRSLTDSIQELAFLNLTQDEFQNLLMGNRMPPNMSLRFRVPLMMGGDLTLDNLFMCRTFPHAQNMDRFIIEQAGNGQIWLPNPAKKVYVPAHTASGGDGGNATSDRLAQMAAQLASDRGMN